MNTFEENKKSVEKMLFFFQDYFNIDIMSKVEQFNSVKMSFSGTLSDLHMHSRLQDTLQAYLRGEMELARINGRNHIVDIIRNLSFKTTDAEGARRAAALFTEIAYCLDGYEEFYEEDRQLLLKAFKQDSLFTEKDFEDEAFKKLDRNYFNKIQQQFSDKVNTFRIYKYLQNQELPSDSSYTVKDHILITSSLDRILSALKPYDDDNVHIALFLKIEPEIDFSYFIISVQYKQSVWLATDFIEFANPKMQTNRRNPHRLSEKRENNNELPYGLIDDVIKWRDEAKTLAKSTLSEDEVYTYNIFELPVYDRIMLSLTFKRVLQEVFEHQFDFKQIMNALTSVSEYEEEENDDKYFESQEKERLEELLADYAFENQQETTSTELAVVSKELAKVYEQHNRLVTKDQLQKEAAWIKHTQIAKKMFNRSEPTTEEVTALKSLVQDNIDRIHSFIFSGKYVSILDIDELIRSDFGANRVTKQLSIFSLVKETAEGYNIHLYHLTEKDANKTLYRHNYEPYCMQCHTYKTKGMSGVQINFHSHKELMLLTGCARQDIPMYYRNYYSSQAFPYIGNHILDNIRPEFVAMEYDPCSKRNPNGLAISLELCGVCKRRLYSKYKKFERSLILYSSKTGKLIDIIDFEQLQQYLADKLNVKVQKGEYGIYYLES